MNETKMFKLRGCWEVNSASDVYLDVTHSRFKEREDLLYKAVMCQKQFCLDDVFRILRKRLQCSTLHWRLVAAVLHILHKSQKFEKSLLQPSTWTVCQGSEKEDVQEDREEMAVANVEGDCFLDLCFMGSENIENIYPVSADGHKAVVDTAVTLNVDHSSSLPADEAVGFSPSNCVTGVLATAAVNESNTFHAASSKVVQERHCVLPGTTNGHMPPTCEELSLAKTISDCCRSVSELNAHNKSIQLVKSSLSDTLNKQASKLNKMHKNLFLNLKSRSYGNTVKESNPGQPLDGLLESSSVESVPVKLSHGPSGYRQQESHMCTASNEDLNALCCSESRTSSLESAHGTTISASSSKQPAMPISFKFGVHDFEHNRSTSTLSCEKATIHTSNSSNLAMPQSFLSLRPFGTSPKDLKRTKSSKHFGCDYQNLATTPSKKLPTLSPDTEHLSRTGGSKFPSRENMVKNMVPSVSGQRLDAQSYSDEVKVVKCTESENLEQQNGLMQSRCHQTDQKERISAELKPSEQLNRVVHTETNHAEHEPLRTRLLAPEQLKHIHLDVPAGFGKTEELKLSKFSANGGKSQVDALEFPDGSSGDVVNYSVSDNRQTKNKHLKRKGIVKPRQSKINRCLGIENYNRTAIFKPLADGWVREVVYRKTVQAGVKKRADIYYKPPHKGKKLRSLVEVTAYLKKHENTQYTDANFSFFQEPFEFGEPYEHLREAYHQKCFIPKKVGEFLDDKQPATSQVPKHKTVRKQKKRRLKPSQDFEELEELQVDGMWVTPYDDFDDMCTDDVDIVIENGEVTGYETWNFSSKMAQLCTASGGDQKKGGSTFNQDNCVVDEHCVTSYQGGNFNTKKQGSIWNDEGINAKIRDHGRNFVKMHTTQSCQEGFPGKIIGENAGSSKAFQQVGLDIVKSEDNIFIEELDISYCEGEMEAGSYSNNDDKVLESLDCSQAASYDSSRCCTPDDSLLNVEVVNVSKCLGGYSSTNTGNLGQTDYANAKCIRDVGSQSVTNGEVSDKDIFAESFKDRCKEVFLTSDDSSDSDVIVLDSDNGCISDASDSIRRSPNLMDDDVQVLATVDKSNVRPFIQSENNKENKKKIAVRTDLLYVPHSDIQHECSNPVSVSRAHEASGNSTLSGSSGLQNNVPPVCQNDQTGVALRSGAKVAHAHNDTTVIKLVKFTPVAESEPCHSGPRDTINRSTSFSPDHSQQNNYYSWHVPTQYNLSPVETESKKSHECNFASKPNILKTLLCHSKSTATDENAKNANSTVGIQSAKISSVTSNASVRSVSRVQNERIHTRIVPRKTGDIASVKKSAGNKYINNNSITCKELLGNSRVVNIKINSHKYLPNITDNPARISGVQWNFIKTAADKTPVTNASNQTSSHPHSVVTVPYKAHTLSANYRSPGVSSSILTGLGAKSSVSDTRPFTSASLSLPCTTSTLSLPGNNLVMPDAAEISGGSGLTSAGSVTTNAHVSTSPAVLKTVTQSTPAGFGSVPRVPFIMPPSFKTVAGPPFFAMPTAFSKNC